MTAALCRERPVAHRRSAVLRIAHPWMTRDDFPWERLWQTGRNPINHQLSITAFASRQPVDGALPIRASFMVSVKLFQRQQA
jgi:hypothetical protein